MSAVPVVCVTDPVCPWSWATEPVLRRLQAEFGAGVAITYVQAGLARDVQDAGELLGATLDAVAATGQAADPRVWRANAPRSSWPACQACKAAGAQGHEGAYLRALREALFLDGHAVDTGAALEAVARRVPGLAAERFAEDLRSREVAGRFAADLDRARAGGRRGRLPFLEVAGEPVRREGLLDAVAAAGAPRGALPDVPAALRAFGRMTTAEVAAVCGLPVPRAAAELWRLALGSQVQVERRVCGEAWRAADGTPAPGG